MARVCMLLQNPLIADPRVEREARALVRAGHDVTVIAIWEPGVTPRFEDRDGFRIRRVSRRPFGVDFITRIFAWLLGPEAWGPSAGRAGVGPASPGTDAGLLRLQWMRFLRYMRRAVRLVRRLLRSLPTKRAAISARMFLAAWRTRPDVVHAHDLNTLEPAARAARVSRARLVYDSHEISPGLPSVRHPEQVIHFERALIGRADAVIHTTPMRAAWAADTYGIPTPYVVRNVPEGQREVAPADLAAEVGFAADMPVIMHQGYMSPDRGLEALVDAMALLEGYGLLFLGGGRLRPALEELVAVHALGDRVRFHDPVPHEELLAWTAGAWCGVSLLVDTCLNHRYSLPNKLFEYLAVGVPVIASRNTEIEAFVSEHDCGELCDPRDPASIAHAVRRLGIRHDEAAGAAREAGARFRWEQEEAVLLDVYRRLLGGVPLNESAASGGSREPASEDARHPGARSGRG